MKKAAAFAGAIVLVSCAPVDEPSKSVAAVEPAVTVIGEAKGCLSAGSIQNTQVRGNGVIDFTVTGGKVCKSTPLPIFAAGLMSVWNTEEERLCR